MSDNITLPRAVVEMVRDSLDYARRFNGASVSAEIAALDAALAEPKPEHIHTCGPDCQKPLCANRRREIAAAVEAEREAILGFCERMCEAHRIVGYVVSPILKEVMKYIRERGSQ